MSMSMPTTTCTQYSKNKLPFSATNAASSGPLNGGFDLPLQRWAWLVGVVGGHGGRAGGRWGRLVVTFWRAAGACPSTLDL